MNFEEKLIKSANEIGISLDESQIKKFEMYMRLLLEWNEKINLTAITNPEEIITKHFIDSLTCTKFIKSGSSLIDVGTGAGFPGLPLKILLGDEINVVLLDSLNKRINFLSEVIKALSLNGIKAIHGRAEEAAANAAHREKYDYATARAVSNLAILAEYCLPFVKIGGYMLSMKGSDVENELSEGRKAISILGGEITSAETITLPFSDIKHSIVEIKKSRITPKGYPRKAGKPEKSPIK